MRSQDATHVLPYDFFMFTMLQEYVATQLDRDVGSYTHIAGSLHVYNRDRGFVDAILASTPSSPNSPMTAMPEKGVDGSLSTLRKFEEEVRTYVVAKKKLPVKILVAETEQMGIYWQQLGLLLLAYGLRQVNPWGDLDLVVKQVREPFATFGDRLLQAARGPQRSILTYP
jgi:thymidylate synthase